MIRSPRALFATSLLSLVVACDGADGDRPGQLEALAATFDLAAHAEDGAELSGPTAVSGSDRDWTLMLAQDDGELATVTVHAPGRSDLSSLHERELQVALGEAWGDDSRTVAIEDELGPVFFGQPFAGGGPAFDEFGSELVDFGEEVGTGSVHDEYGTYEVSYRLARFQTDDGPIDALPGEPFEASFDGVTWRVVVHASFEVTEYPDTMPGCDGGTSTTLAFEMLRTEMESSLDAISRPAGLAMAGQRHC